MPLNDEATRLARIETKLDRLGEGLERIARIEERQTAHLDRQARLEERHDAMDKRVGELEKDRHQRTPFIGMLKAAAVAAIGALIALIVRGGNTPTH